MIVDVACMWRQVLITDKYSSN